MTDKLQAKLNAETARIHWHELERHFARGVLITVGRELDLIEVAAAMARDDKAAVQTWLTAGTLRRTGADEAEQWARRDTEFWSVVVAPWVLVQELRS